MNYSINKNRIQKQLSTEILGKEFHIFKSIKSTNDYAKKKVHRNGAVVLAEEQTAGKGLLGRTWISPPNKSILMSVVIEPAERISVQLLNLAGGLAVAEALEQSTSVKPSLHWPNDVFVREKKICGVLTESRFSGSSVAKFVIGIGLNVNQKPEDFPANLRHPATSVDIETEETADRNILIGYILNNLDDLIRRIYAKDYKYIIINWKKFSDQIGKRVRILQGDITKNGIFRDIADDGGAQIREDNSSEETIYSGEIFTLQ